MGFIGWIIVGIVAGFIAEKVTKSNHGLVTNLIVGLVGAFVGGFIASRFHISFVQNALLDTTIIATLGAILVLFIYQKVRS
ncbi:MULTISPECIES: GlsB/YeaQ/YmgE family stress response membrane protein [Cohaesibacter]|uniref:GlsB/YeaQ/YmgE family stress response membrane protein n=1 Tax=Cohaesibacter TaxID=655352 RepID=UPI000DE81536|nr:MULTISPECIES: GlsB/YeaQ/YmgE family stress response membrane protein [Cohaesibacter]TLP49068.1 GlsB/YeaQ/YmgE family stress response membrane protein [Cohaesibacter sp. CAU 1516]